MRLACTTAVAHLGLAKVTDESAERRESREWIHGMSESRWRRIQHLVLEGIVIVFSVLVALVVEDWRAEREAADDVEAALVALDIEVQANLEELESFATVVTDRYNRLIAFGPEVDGSVPFSEYVGRFGGYLVPDLDVSAWARISSDPGANRVAPERLREAFILYYYLDFLTRLDDQIIQLTFGPGYHDPARAVITFRISEAILSQQLEYAQLMAAQHRAYLEVRP